MLSLVGFSIFERYLVINAVAVVDGGSYDDVVAVADVAEVASCCSRDFCSDRSCPSSRLDPDAKI
jgi:hypothetical protein